MQIRTKNFPWRLLRKFLFKSSILFVVVFAGLYFVFQNLFLSDLQTLFPQMEWQSFLNTVLLLILGSSLVLFSGMIAFVFIELLVPLGVLYSRVKAIREQKEDEAFEDLSQGESGEWTDIELAVEDIRQRLKKSQRRFRRDSATISTLLDAIPEAIFAVNREGLPTFYNSTFLNIFGLTVKNIESLRVSEWVRSPEVLAAIDSTLTNKTINRAQVKIVTDDVGKTKMFQVTVAPLNDPERERMYGAVCVFQDVTEIKQLEQIRIDFVANVSHELRTPLTSVKGYAQTLLEDVKARRFDQGEKYLEVVNKNVDRLLVLVSDLLDLSSLDSGVDLQCSKLSPQVTTQAVLEQLEPIRQSKKINIKTEYAIENFLGDESRVQQVLTNLIQNAIQYIPEGKNILVAWKPIESAVELHVQDDGPGIGHDQKSRIFERFYRVDRARTRESGGTGLGLAIVKHIMQRHGGSVRVESTKGSGTDFICVFPNK